MRFALLVFYAAGTLAVPVPDERIPKAVVSNIDCSPPFQPGRTYEYYGETMNQVEGTSTSKTGLMLQSLVTISRGFDDCSFLMTLSSTDIRSKAMNEDRFKALSDSAFARNLEENHLVFSMKGKQISTIRPRKGETTEILNIKKGILSAFQLDEKATVETDINGECQTTITTENNMVIKSKTLTDCSKRAQSEIGIQSASIKTDMDLKPLDSKSVCKYMLTENGEIMNAVCEETHLFKPFSAGYKTPSGAMTIVTQKLTMSEVLMKVNIKIENGHFAEPTSVVFQHVRQDEAESTPNQQLAVVDDVMSKLISKSQKSATESSAKEFTNLVMLLRKMDDKMMASIWDKYFDCITSKVCEKDENNMKDLYRQYMLDAIAYCGTPSCVSVVKDVTVNGEVSGERANAFLMSIAFVAKTTDGMIRDILDIAQQKPSRQVFLTLGTLISRHCAKSPASCQSGAVVEAENFLVKTLGKCAGQERFERVEEIIMALKAMGNAKRPLNARNDLLKCAIQTTHTNVSMSAFDALRSMPCDETTTKNLNQIVADKSIDEEKRIYAFTATMACPTKINLEQVVAIYNSLDATQSQLASFMWTQLTNLMESGNPDNKEAKAILAEITKATPLNVHSHPIYTHSRNMEKSLYMDYLKTGVSAKANLVFNPESILPKTAMFDMTAKVMGVPVDLVETVVGIDGIESLIDNINLPEVFAFDIFKTNLAEKWQELQQKKNVERNQRKTKSAEVTKPKQFSGFMSMKVMGQELRVLSYDDIYAMIEEIDNMNVIQLLSKIAKGGEKTFSKSMMFLEMTYTVPTGVGLPLKLKLTGTTVGSMEMSGKLDMRNMFWGPGALTVDGMIKPTAVVEITGKMGVESKFVSTGLMVSSNMMVSNMMKGSIEYKAGKILKVNVDTPSEPVQLFKSSSTPYMFMNEKTDMIASVARSINTAKCLKSQIIGYGLCTSLNVPVAFRDYEAPYFPLSGPSHFGVSLVRGDEKLTTFEFLMSMTKTANGVDGIIEFSTPKAAYERKLSGKMSYTDVESKKVLTLTTEPFGKVSSVEFAYDGVSKSASIQAKNNFFTTKDVVATLSIHNQTNPMNTQYGILAAIEHDGYKIEHISKYVKKATGHKVLSKTIYAPGKVVSGSLEYNRVDKKLIATAEASQFNQAVEVMAQLGSNADGEGLIFTATHVPTKKSVTLFSGIKNEPEKKEFTVSFKVGNKTAKNTLGWYRNGEVYSIEDMFSYDKKTAKVAASVENRIGEKAVRLTADIFGKRAMSSIVYNAEGTSKVIDVNIQALGKSANLNGKLENTEDLKSLVFNVDVMGKKAKSALVYTNVNTTKTVSASVGQSKIEAVLDNKADVKTLRFNADILGKTATSSVQYKTEDRAARQTLRFFANIMGKETSTAFVLTNVHDQKSLRMIVDVIGKTAEGSVGFYRENNAVIFRIAGTAAGKSANLFWRIEKFEGYRSVVGFVADKYIGGFRSSFTKQVNNIGACASVYYGLATEEKTAMASCIEFNSFSNINVTHLQGKVSMELPVLKKKVELVTDLTKKVGRVTMISKTLFNEKVISKIEFDADFKEPSNSAVTLSVMADKYDVSLKTFIQTVNTETTLRFEMSSMGKTLEFTNTYEKDGGLMKLTTNVILNGKTLPVSSVIGVANGKGVTGTTFSVILGDYAAVYKCNFNYAGKFGMSSELLALKKEKIIAKVFHKLLATINEANKEIDHKFGAVVMDKLFEYGWSLGYSKQEVVAKVQYATKRTSTLTVSLNNGAKMAKVNVVFEYIPTKKVSHSVSYNKETKQMDISMEFLPKMFAKFMGRLENNNGYQLVTSTHLQWKNFETSMSSTYSYVNTNETVELSAKVNKDTFVTLSYYKGVPKAITIKVSVLGKTGTFVVSYVNKIVTVQLDVNGKQMFKVQGDYNEIVKMIITKRDELIAYLKNGYETVLKDLKNLSEKLMTESKDFAENFLKEMKIINEKMMKEMKVVNEKIVKEWKIISEKLMKELKAAAEKIMGELKVVKERAMEDFKGLIENFKVASDEIKAVVKKVQEFIERMKKWISVKVKSKGSVTTFNFKLLGKRFKKLVFNKKKRTLSIQYKTKFAVTFAHLPKKNAISITYKGKKNRGTVTLRADLKTMKASALLDVNNVNIAGIKIYADKLGLNFKLIATPDFYLNTIFSKTDNSLKMEVNRIVKKVVVNEITAEYILSSNSSEFVFKWNEETIAKAVEQVRELGKPIADKLKSLLHKVLDGYTLSYGKMMEMTIEAKAEILKFLNRMEIAFDEVDFMKVCNKLSQMTVNALKKTTTCTSKALNKLATIIDLLKDNLPKQVEKIREFIKMIKPDVVTAKAQQIIAKAQQIVSKLNDIKLGAQLEKVKVVIEKIVVIVTKVVKKFVDTNAPIIKKAVTLLKDFKIRGQRIEDLVKDASTQGIKLVKVYAKKVNMALNKMRLELEVAVKDITKYVMNLNVPRTNKTVAQVIELIKIKLTELKEKVKALDAKQLIKELKAMIMEYKIKGKTITQHIVELKKKISELKTQIVAVAEKYKNLPEQAKKEFRKLVKVCKKYIKDIEVYAQTITIHAAKVAEFAKPLTNYLIIVKASIAKHYGPMYKEVEAMIVKELQKLKIVSTIKTILDEKLTELTDLTLPIMKPLIPMYNNLKNQINSIEGMDIEKFEKTIEVLVTEAKMELNKEIKMITKWVEQLKTYTTTDMIEKVVKKIVAYLNTVYSEKKDITIKYLKDVEEIYSKVKTQLIKLKSAPIAAITDKIVEAALEKTITSAAQVSSLIKKVAEFDVAKMVDGRLGNMNRKIATIVNYAKEANLTKIVLDIVEKIEKVVIATSQDAVATVLKDYKIVHEKLSKVIESVKSISKKDYDAWIAEMKTMTTDVEKKIVQWVKDLIENSGYTLADTLAKLQKLATADLKIAKSYVAAVEKYYSLIVSKAGLVYADVKQPTIEVITHYRSIIETIINKYYAEILAKYETIKAQITTELKKYYNELKAQIENIPELKEKLIKKAEELKLKTEKIYGELMTKYGNMTWEQVVAAVEKFILNEITTLKTIALSKQTLVIKKVAELKQKVIELYEKAIKEIKRIEFIVKTEMINTKAVVVGKMTQIKGDLITKYNEIRPKINAALVKLETMIKEEVKKVLAKIELVYTTAKGKVTEIYGINKDKTLKQIYLEIRKLITKSFLAQKKIVGDVVAMNVFNVNAKVTTLYKDLESTINNVIIPEVKQELESIFNQTLRNTVIMSKEIVKAYAPLAVITTKAVTKLITATKAEIPAFIEQATKLAEINLPKLKAAAQSLIAKLETKVTELKDAIKQDKTYEKLVALVEAKIVEIKQNPRFIKIQKEVVELIAKLEKIIKEKITELKKNPTLIHMEAKLAETKKIFQEKFETKIVELKKFIKENVEVRIAEMTTKVTAKIVELKKYILAKLEELKMNPTYLKIKAELLVKLDELKNTAAWCKTQIEKIQNSKELAQVIETLQQLRTSGKFTADKLQELIKPYLENTIKSTKAEVVVIQNWTHEFLDAPEEKFWTSYAENKEALVDSYTKVVSTSMKDIVDDVEKVIAFSLNVYETCTDEWTKKTIGNAGVQFRNFVINLTIELKKLEKNLPVLAKKYFDDALASLKTIAQQQLTKATKLTKEQIVMLTKYWETSPLKAFVDTPVLGEIIDEIKNHELVALAMQINDASAKQVIVLKNAIIKIYNEQKPILEKKLADLKMRAITTYTEMMTKMTTAYERIEVLITKTIKMIEETKISDIVSFVETKFADIVKKSKTLKVQVTEKVKLLLGQYEKKMNEIYGKVSAKMAVYKKQMMKVYKELAQKVEEVISKYRPIVEEQYKQVVLRLVAQYNELKGKALFIREKLEKLAGVYGAKIIEVRMQLLKTWDESIVRAKIVAFSKMTVKETVEILGNVPVQIKKYITVEYAKVAAKITDAYRQVRIFVTEKVKAELEKIMKVLKPILANGEHVYQLVDNEIKETVEFVYRYYNVQEKYDILRELVTAELNAIKRQVIAEVTKYKKMLAAVPEKIMKTVNGYKKMIKDTTEQYKAALIKTVTECVGKCKKRVEAFVKEVLATSKVSGDKTLRAIHAAIKTLGTIEPALKQMISDIRAQITFTQFKGKFVIGITHPEVVPSFSYQLKNIKEMPNKIRIALIVKGKEIYDKTTAKIEELKKELVVKIEELKVVIKKYTKIIKENAPIIAEKVKVALKKYIELVKGKMSEMVIKAKQAILKFKGDVAKTQKLIDDLVGKLETKLVELKEKVRQNPKFQKIVAFIETKIAELKKMLKEKIAEGKAVATKTIEQLKTKGTELVEKLKLKAGELKVTITKYVEVIKAQATAKANEIKVIVTEYIRIIKKKAGVIVGEAKIIVKKYVKIIKQKTSAVVAQVKVETEKVRQMMKETAAKIEMKLNELKATITKDKRYIKLAAFVEKMLKELKKLINENMTKGKAIAQKAIVKGKELMTKLEAKLVELKKTIIARVQVIKEQAPVMIKKVIADLEARLRELKHAITTNKKYIEFVAFVEAKIAELKKLVNTKIAEIKPQLMKIKKTIEDAKILIEKEIKATLTKSKEFIKATIPKIQKKLQKLIQKIKSNEMYIFLEKKIAKLVKIIKAQIEELKKRANPVIIKMKAQGTKMIKEAKDLIRDLKEKTAELRQDLMTSFNANKNITVYLYNNAKTVAIGYYKNAIVVADQIKTVSRATYVKMIKLYNELAKSSLKQVCKDAVAYGKAMYATVKKQCIAKYSEAEKLIKESIVVLKQKGLNIEKELKNYYKALKNAYKQVKAGAPVKEVLKSLFTQIFGKIDIKSFDVKSVICKNDPALCKLVRESWKLHKTLLKKYAEKN